MQHTSPLEKGRKRGDYLYRTDVLYKLLGSYAAHLSPWKGEKERGLLISSLVYYLYLV